MRVNPKLYKYVFLKNFENNLKRLGNTLIVFGILGLQIQIYRFMKALDRNLSQAKKELVDNLNILTEEEFEVIAENSKKTSQKEIFNLIFKDDIINIYNNIKKKIGL